MSEIDDADMPEPEMMTLLNIPKPVGSYVVGQVKYKNGPVTTYQGLHIQMLVKPNWLHRSMMRWFFGWVWVDET